MDLVDINMFFKMNLIPYDVLLIIRGYRLVIFEIDLLLFVIISSLFYDVLVTYLSGC